MRSAEERSGAAQRDAAGQTRLPSLALAASRRPPDPVGAFWAVDLLTPAGEPAPHPRCCRGPSHDPSAKPLGTLSEPSCRCHPRSCRAPSRRSWLRPPTQEADRRAWGTSPPCREARVGRRRPAALASLRLFTPRCARTGEWAALREQLCAAAPANAASLKQIDEAPVAACSDTSCATLPLPASPHPSLDTAPRRSSLSAWTGDTRRKPSHLHFSPLTSHSHPLTLTSHPHPLTLTLSPSSSHLSPIPSPPLSPAAAAARTAPRRASEGRCSPLPHRSSPEELGEVNRAMLHGRGIDGWLDESDDTSTTRPRRVLQARDRPLVRQVLPARGDRERKGGHQL